MKRQVTQSDPKGLEIWFSKWGWYFGTEAKHGTDGTFHIYIQQNLSLAEVTYFPDVQCSVSTYCMLLEKVFLGALLIQEVFHPFCFSFIKSGEICGNITPTPSSWTKTRLSSLETHFLSQTWGKSSKISPSSESAPVCRIWFVFHKKCKTNTLCFSPFTQLCLTTRRKAKTHWISHKCNTRYRNNKVSTFLNFLTPYILYNLQLVNVRDKSLPQYDNYQKKWQVRVLACEWRAFDEDALVENRSNDIESSSNCHQQPRFSTGWTSS